MGRRPDRTPERVERNAEIGCLVCDTNRTLEDIGQQYGISRERVRQIALKERGVSRQNERADKAYETRTCPVCKVSFVVWPSSVKKCCSHKCKGAAQRAITGYFEFNCATCGKPVKRINTQRRSKSGKYFCDKVCQGKHIWKWGL